MTLKLVAPLLVWMDGLVPKPLEIVSAVGVYSMRASSWACIRPPIFCNHNVSVPCVLLKGAERVLYALLTKVILELLRYKTTMRGLVGANELTIVGVEGSLIWMIDSTGKVITPADTLLAVTLFPV